MTHKTSYHEHKINVKVEGTGEVVMFLHGLPTNAHLWNAQHSFFKSRYKVITPEWLALISLTSHLIMITLLKI